MVHNDEKEGALQVKLETCQHRTKVYLFLGVILALLGCNKGYVVTKRGVTWEIWSTRSGTEIINIEAADPSSFEVLTWEVSESVYNFARDKGHVYYRGEVILGADPSSFRPHKRNYFVDSKRVFLKQWNDFHELIGCSPQTMRIIDDFWIVDEKYVYFAGHRLEPTDIRSFFVYPDSGWACDDIDCYYENVKVTVDRESFESLPDARSVMAKDRNNVYWCGWVVEGCDHDSFQAIDNWSGKDKNNHFRFRSTWANRSEAGSLEVEITPLDSISQ